MRKVLPPKTMIRLIKLWPHARKQGRDKGQIYRVGYYCKSCGTDTIWLVDKKGEYGWTVDREFIEKYFEIIELSKERSIYGKGRPKLGPLKESG
jgi:hypothetical protein